MSKPNYGGVQRAERYSGSIKVTCRFDDAKNRYVCAISRGGRLLGRQYVGLPGAWASLPEYRRGVDSPEAFDGAAQAALAFAVDEDERGEKDWGGIASDLDYADDGIRVVRAPNLRIVDIWKREKRS